MNEINLFLSQFCTLDNYILVKEKVRTVTRPSLEKNMLKFIQNFGITIESFDLS